MSRLESLTGRLNLPFQQYENPPDSPKEIINEWITQARSGDVREPDAYTLATCNAASEITMRTMFPIGIDGEVMLFATHSCSRKGSDIRESGIASAHIYWREIGRQLSLSGTMVLADESIAEASWNARDAAYDPLSVVSHQSEILHDFFSFSRDVKEYENQGKQPKPKRFVVYTLKINRCEFWSATQDRIHQRLVYTLTEKGWFCERLQP
ncbi:pyridoxamine 5'-phosphate oxidase [Vibrio crassostreae]|uniref:pyridoxine 5'-phosphate oxidase C-terminal domain-containing protein n=1 Tax=Vibrio crassostreae TaxID=246167 RepID=UPI00104F015A|nr:pyridoxine 5'-phosphate oxidase C-terminal domain-containing protein [Vibrio crassostreae]TCN75905.1 pyridoxamine 5'-phosphate oxidase [Vibrio crassostreae]CAK2533249.1 pyridoxamine 5'-phosphate oxidase [Vibrio crassostreae]CAK3889157.1 pyridoxamine 5'-phosphate oxidase [Vibrio crassostreae]